MSCITDEKCDKLTGEREDDLQTCALCRDVLKIDLARIVLGMTPIYLTEDTRNKGGRPQILNHKDRYNIKYAHRNGQSMDQLAEIYGVSKATIFNIVHK